MTDLINTYSSTFKYDLEDFFDFEEKNVTNFLTTTLPNLLNEDDQLKNTIQNFKKLKTFLGHKRNKTIKKEEIIENPEYFKNIETLKNINTAFLSIDKTYDEDLVIEDIIGKQSERLTIFSKPIILAQLFDLQSICIDLINDHLTLEKKINYFNQFNFKIYTISNNNNELNVLDELNLANINNSPLTIGNESIYSYLFIINSKLPEISDNDLLFENIYKKNEQERDLISPINISKIYFYYFRINSHLQKKYLYIESENRKKLYDILSKFLTYPFKKVIIIVGPKGVGKSSSLIKFSFRKELRIFYFNLESFQINYEENKKKILKIQLAKLFGIFKQNDEENIKKEIEDYIDKNCKKNCFEFIYKIIELFIKFAKNIKGSYFGFIIDQYSLNCNNNEYDIHKIINLIDTSDKIKLILSPTINNMLSKEQMNSIFEKCLKITIRLL